MLQADMQNNILASLTRLSDDDLVARLKGLVARDHDLTAQIVAHLAELDTRDVFLREATARCSSTAVWLRDLGRCAFVGTSHRCNERRFVEFHHIDPHALGGEATVDQIQLRCRRHNDYEGRLYFGKRRRGADGGVVKEEPARYRSCHSIPGELVLGQVGAESSLSGGALSAHPPDPPLAARE